MVLTNIAGNHLISMKKTIPKGRRKIEIKKIEKSDRRQVTFSKRRTGLFNKASELCVLTGAQVAILVNSPGGKVFSFGHPNVNDLIQRYLNSNGNGYSPPPLPPAKEFTKDYVEVSRELEAEKKRMKKMIEPSDSGGGSRWFDEPIDGLGVEELERYLLSLAELKKKVLERADGLMMIDKSLALFGCRNVFEKGWDDFDGGLTVGFPTNAAVHGGCLFPHGGETAKF